MPRLPTEELAAFIGIDWADAKHAISLQAAGAETCEFSVLDHQPDIIDEGGEPLARMVQRATDGHLPRNPEGAHRLCAAQV
jgi:hypothetical protein